MAETPTVRRLGPGDETILALLAREDADLELEACSAGRAPLDADAARAFLADDYVLHWVAEGEAGAEATCMTREWSRS